MSWTNKKQSINPIPSSVEISLLKKAYSIQPKNQRVLAKLIDGLLHGNQLEQAIELCQNHQQQYPQDDHIYALLTYLYRKTNDLDALIEVGEAALGHSPKTDTRIQLAYAYAQNDLYDQAVDSLPHEKQFSNMQTKQLRVVLETLLRIGQAEQVCQIYQALQPSQLFDSGLKSYYLKALYKLGMQTEVDLIINYRDFIQEYSLAKLNGGKDIGKLNNALESFFLSHPKQQHEPGNHTSRYGSQMHFESSWHPALGKLEDKIKAAVEHYLTERSFIIADSNQLFTLNLWSNTLNKKGYQISHLHPDAFVSGVYYVSVPESVKQAEQTGDHQGCLLFSQPETLNHRYVQPDEGLIVVFPSYFYHQTVPLEHDGTRICVAFDVVREDKL